MRWVRFEHEGNARLGSLEDGQIQPITARSMQEVIGSERTKSAGNPIPFGRVRPLAPLRPGKIIAVGQNYMDHIREQDSEPPGIPVLFPKFPSNVIGPEEEICWPEDLTQQVDYEAELAVVMGEGGRCLQEEDALEAVFGYTAANDVSARDLQFSNGGQWTRGKAVDTFLPLGPTVVGREEVPDPQALPIVCRVNGETLQDSNTKEMVFTVAQLVAFVSHSVALEPGDVILTGTPHGVGVFRDPQVFLTPGDTVEVEVADFGVLANPVREYSGSAYPEGVEVPRAASKRKETQRVPDVDGIDLATLLAKQEIAEVLYRRARAGDRRDVELAVSCYHKGATESHEGFSGTAADFIRDVSMISPHSTAPVSCLWHSISNVLIELHGDEADVESYHLAMVIRNEDDGQTQALIGGRYLDRFARRAGKWAIAHRDVVFDWSRVDTSTINYWDLVGLDESKLLLGRFGAGDPLYSHLDVGRG